MALRILFTRDDLMRVRMATTPDPLWEITNSLDRLQTSEGRPAFAHWYHDTRDRLAATGFERTVRSVLIPLLPRAAYFPDFLTPAEARDGLDAGLEAILGTPDDRVRTEIRKLAELHQAPAWAHQLTDGAMRKMVVTAVRAYHDLAIAPHEAMIYEAVCRDHVIRNKALQEGGIEEFLASFRPLMRWSAPVLDVVYPVDREIALNGRGLLLVPSYFCWRHPVALADPELPPVLIYPLLDLSTPRPPFDTDRSAGDLLGTTRAAVLRCTRNGTTTSEIARAIGVSAQTVSHHITKLRDSRLVTSRRIANRVLHAITPLGRAILAPSTVADIRLKSL